MDITIVFGLAALLFIYYVIGKILIALSNTWVGDLLIGSGRQSKSRSLMRTEQEHWDKAPFCATSPYHHLMNADTDDNECFDDMNHDNR